MIKKISMPMMAPTDGSSSSVSELTWDDIPSAGPADIQSGRNVYIELNEERTATKASAGKILQFIKEGYMPVFKVVIAGITYWIACEQFSTFNNAGEAIIEYLFVPSLSPSPLVRPLYAYSDALDKPFTTIERSSGGDSANA